MRIGIRSAISGLVLASIVISAVGVHLLWWRTAHQVSQTLADTINDQIVSAVGDELQSITTEALSAMIAVRTLFTEKVLDPRDAKKREFVFLSQIQAQPAISWVAFAWPDGSFFAGHKLGESAIRMLEIPPGGGKLKSDRFELRGADVVPTESHTEETSYSVTDQSWYQETNRSGQRTWLTFSTHPDGIRPAAGVAVPIDIDGQRAGVLAVIIELTRVSNFLSQLTSGKSAGAFILDRDGNVIAAPDPDADELNPLKTNHPLLPVAVEAIQQAGSAYDTADAQAFRTSVTHGNTAFAAVLTPISFPGWSLVTVIPESEFLGPVEATIRKLLIGLVVLIVLAGAMSAWLAQRLIAAPLIRVVGEIRHVERFDLDKVQRHSSRLTEIGNLSGAIGDMAQGLAAFRKYIPADVVRRLITEGSGAQLGGAVRTMSVMFVDLAGFTGMSERMGEGVIPLLSRYFDEVSKQIQSHDGTIDKFIGDAAMAFWGAPAKNLDHALDCCRAALACQRAVKAASLVGDNGEAVRIRIGINSGDMLVGNIGSEVRLNYTVIGDAVNIASRLESINKLYGSTIIIGPDTRRLAGEAIVVRELDRLAVYGRTGGLQIYELLGIAGEFEESRDWIASYESGLTAWRKGKFSTAIAAFERAVALRGQDEPSRLMIERCSAQMATPLPEDWDGTTAALTK